MDLINQIMKNKILMSLIFILPFLAAGSLYADDSSWSLSYAYASDIRDIEWGFDSDKLKRKHGEVYEFGAVHKLSKYMEALLNITFAQWEYYLNEGDVYEHKGVNYVVSGSPNFTIKRSSLVASIRQYYPLSGKSVHIFGQFGAGLASHSTYAHNPITGAAYFKQKYLTEVVPAIGIFYQTPIPVSLGVEAKYHFSSLETSGKNYYTLHVGIKSDF
ncbi:MAG: hypothetical protein HZB80_01775 [Deltaproteobacteria bacterium]|nr:hypothetical protein [Deltaproteobacteria bacterium]